MFFIYLLVLCAVNVDGAMEGEVCTHNDVTGVCVELSKCTAMLEDPILRKDSAACDSRGSGDIVCCYSPKKQQDQCEPLPDSMTAKKTGMKAWDKCIDYQQLVYPCRDGIRERLCPHEDDISLFLDSDKISERAKRHEFPHMVMMGFTNARQQVEWVCGGVLVSERFVLTAGQCTTTNQGLTSHVAIHPTDRSDIDPDTIFKVKAVIKHPEYRPPMVYHDIALVELEQPVPLGPTTVPACLLFNGPSDAADPPAVIATTWNMGDVLKTGITWLRKVRLSKYSKDECSRLYPLRRRGGYNDTSQVCYGDRAGAKDVCQDDGGNPLVVTNSQSCMYTAIGLASYGRGCFSLNPGVYTRIQPYLPWIESIVWP